MTFVKYGTHWYIWHKKEMYLENINGGFVDIDENCFAWVSAEVQDFDSWHQLYLATHYNPFTESFNHKYLWVNPEGECCNGDGHCIVAPKIIEVIYGEDVQYGDDYLINKGWIKLSTFMYDTYAKCGMYKNITTAQWEVLSNWCKYYNLPISLNF